MKEFTNFVREIPEMPDKDSLFFFMDGLQAWAKTEVRRRGVQDLATAIAIAESLIDYSTTRDIASKPKDKKYTSSRSTTSQGSAQHKEEARVQSPSKPKEDKGKLKTTWKGLSVNNKYVLCDGPHFMRDCPTKHKINAMNAGAEPSHAEGSKDGVHIGSLQLLNIIRAAPKTQAK